MSDRNFRVGYFQNGTAMLQIEEERHLDVCDGGSFTCEVNTTSGHYETRNFTLTITSMLIAL